MKKWSGPYVSAILTVVKNLQQNMIVNVGNILCITNSNSNTAGLFKFHCYGCKGVINC